MKKYDYILTGMGVSGLMMAYRMCQDSYFNNKSVLLIDNQDKTTKAHVWCYWIKDEDPWKHVVEHEWSEILFTSPNYKNQTSIAPYSYKMVQSEDFYEYVWKLIDMHENFAFAKEKVVDIVDKGSEVIVQTSSKQYHTQKVLNSILLNYDYQNSTKYPLINQHFVGWVIKTIEPTFDVSVATFMDFTVPQKGNTRFMYMLPTSPTEALFEYTLFSKELLPFEAYEAAIRGYLNERNIYEYTILSKESGSIPMTCYPFERKNSANVLHMGSTGGWTKASTGYTFHATTKKTAHLVEHLKINKALSEFTRRSKFWYYDLLLLDVLAKNNKKGSLLFITLFKNVKVQRILKFLDEETNFLEDLSIMISMPQWTFINAILLRIKTFLRSKNNS